MTAPDLGSGDFSALAATLGVPEAARAPTPKATDESNKPASESWAPPSDAGWGVPGAPPPPPEPQTLKQAGLTAEDVEALVLKTLMQMGSLTGSQLAASACLSRKIIGESLNALREELMVSIKASAGVHDYVFQLTDAGFDRARRYAKSCNYIGSAPVTLEAYDNAIRRQSIQRTRMTLERLGGAFADMTLRPELVSVLAQAIHNGRGMFLYGPPGNGKTTIAERVCDAFGEHLWIPQMITVGGDLVRLFDPSCHQLASVPQLNDLRYDRRWVLIRRPTVVVGGELTLEQLDTRFNASAGISEAPVQLKANGGVLLIDDFGRQRVGSTEILNRLIVPLEKQFDFLNLSSGRQIQTPFDLLFVLSTNLEPKELVDEAFLRRIPYKIEVDGPDEEGFRRLFAESAGAMGYELADGVVDHLIGEHYRASGRAMRFCQPRDLLRQVKNYCEVHDRPKRVDDEAIDAAVRNYFAGL